MTDTQFPRNQIPEVQPARVDEEPLQRDTPAPWLGIAAIAFFVFAIAGFIVTVLYLFP